MFKISWIRPLLGSWLYPRNRQVSSSSNAIATPIDGGEIIPSKQNVAPSCESTTALIDAGEVIDLDKVDVGSVCVISTEGIENLVSVTDVIDTLEAARLYLNGNEGVELCDSLLDKLEKFINDTNIEFVLGWPGVQNMLKTLIAGLNQEVPQKVAAGLVSDLSSYLNEAILVINNGVYIPGTNIYLIKNRGKEKVSNYEIETITDAINLIKSSKNYDLKRTRIINLTELDSYGRAETSDLLTNLRWPWTGHLLTDDMKLGIAGTLVHEEDHHDFVRLPVLMKKDFRFPKELSSRIRKSNYPVDYIQEIRAMLTQMEFLYEIGGKDIFSIEGVKSRLDGIDVTSHCLDFKKCKETLTDDAINLIEGYKQRAEKLREIFGIQ